MPRLSALSLHWDDATLVDRRCSWLTVITGSEDIHLWTWQVSDLYVPPSHLAPGEYHGLVKLSRMLDQNKSSAKLYVKAQIKSFHRLESCGRVGCRTPSQIGSLSFGPLASHMATTNTCSLIPLDSGSGKVRSGCCPQRKAKWLPSVLMQNRSHKRSSWHMQSQHAALTQWGLSARNFLLLKFSYCRINCCFKIGTNLQGWLRSCPSTVKLPPARKLWCRLWCNKWERRKFQRPHVSDFTSCSSSGSDFMWSELSEIGRKHFFHFQTLRFFPK